MAKYISSRSCYSISDGTCGNYNELIHLLNAEQKPLDKFVKDTLPLDSSKTIINVKGSHELLEAYRSIDNEVGKLDIITELKNIVSCQITEDKELLLLFDDSEEGPPISATSLYKASNQFYKLFDMDSYANFLIENNLSSHLESNIQYLLNTFSERKNQFRLLIVNNNYLLRGITSSTYKNYDNNIIIYLILYLTDLLNSKQNTSFEISRFFLSDSSIRFFIEDTIHTVIPGVGTIHFGAMISNNEIKEGKVYVELHFRIVDEDGNNSFGCIPRLDKAFIQVPHSKNIENAIPDFLNFNSILQQRNIMTDFIKALSSVKVLDENIARFLFNKITNSKVSDITQSTKKSFKELYDKDLVKNTYSLIEGLNIVTNLSSVIDEKIALERIYYELLLEIQNLSNQTGFVFLAINPLLHRQHTPHFLLIF